MPARSTYQPPSRPAGDRQRQSEVHADQPDLLVGEALSTQNGLTMKPIAASPSLNSRMNSRIEIMPRARQQLDPGAEHRPFAHQRGARAARRDRPSARRRGTSVRPAAPLEPPGRAPPSTPLPAEPPCASGASAGHSSPVSTSASAAIHSGWSRSSAARCAQPTVLLETRARSRGASRAIRAVAGEHRAAEQRRPGLQPNQPDSISTAPANSMPTR